MVSFVGAVGTLMAESGLAEILASVFGGVGKMLIGKKFPMNMRATCMRMVAEELFRDIVRQSNLMSHDCTGRTGNQKSNCKDVGRCLH